jgi:hypothetical protein
VEVRFTARKGPRAVSGFTAKGLVPCEVPTAEVDGKGSFEATCAQSRGKGRGVWVVSGNLSEGEPPQGKIIRRLKLKAEKGKEAKTKSLTFGWTAKPDKP